MKMTIYMQIVILHRIKVWREKSLADFSKLTNFICQKFCNSTMYYYQYFNVFANLYFAKLIFTFLPNFSLTKLLFYTRSTHSLRGGKCYKL